MAPTKIAPVSVPSLEEVSPALARMTAKRTELEAMRSSIDRRLKDLDAGKIPDDLMEQDRALALLGDALPGEATKTVVSRTAVAERRRALRAERDDVQRALGVLERESGAAVQAASKAVCEQIRPQYEALLRECALRLIAVLEVHRALVGVTDQLEINDVRWLGNLPAPTSLRPFLGATQPEHTVQQFLSDLLASGTINRADLKGTQL